MGGFATGIETGTDKTFSTLYFSILGIYQTISTSHLSATVKVSRKP